MNFDTAIDLDIRKFWRWWTRELAELMPETFRHFIDDKRGQVIVSPSGDRLDVSYRHGDLIDRVGRFERSSTGIAEFAKLLNKDAKFEKADIVVRLASGDTIAKKLVFPLAVAENVEQVIAYELDRYTPFKASQVYFAVKLLDKNKQSGQISVMLVVTPKDKLDALIELFGEVDVSLAQVDAEQVDNQTNAFESAYNLLPVSMRKKAPILPGIIHGGLVTLFCLLLMTAMVLPVWRQARAVEKLQDLVTNMEKEARNVENLQKEADALIAQTQSLISKKQNQPSILEMLNELSRVIKDDTWLTYLQFTNGRVQFQGQSPSSSALIGILEDSPLFSNARFVSPVTQDPRGGLERFQITADVVVRQP